MPKGYWIASYHSVQNPAALGKYAEAAGPVLTSFGARFLLAACPPRFTKAVRTSAASSLNSKALTRQSLLTKAPPIRLRSRFSRMLACVRCVSFQAPATSVAAGVICLVAAPRQAPLSREDATLGCARRAGQFARDHQHHREAGAQRSCHQDFERPQVVRGRVAAGVDDDAQHDERHDGRRHRCRYAPAASPAP